MATATSSSHDMGPLILLVEDEPLVRMTLATMLQTGGFQVMPVVHADEALEILEAVPDISAVVTDVELTSSGLDGFELARRVRSRWNIGVVIASGRARPDQHELCDGVHFIAKPVHRATLTHLVKSAVESRSSTRVATSKTDPRQAQASDAMGVARTLTARQQAVLDLLVQGMSNRDIAEALGMAENTVKVHLAVIFRALGVSSRVQAVLAGSRGSAPHQDSERATV
jgi:DNA-binding NarL/FixJ family response regulator